MALFCLGCFRELEEYDVVQVIAKSLIVPEAEMGDRGAVLMVLNSERGEKGYEIECVLPNGTNKWQGTFERNQLKWLQPPND